VNGENESHLLTIRAAAKFLRVSPEMIYRLVRTGGIPGAIKVKGRWQLSVEQLERWIGTAEYGASRPMKRKKV
jgi:excisionase family DNA binding protein